MLLFCKYLLPHVRPLPSCIPRHLVSSDCGIGVLLGKIIGNVFLFKVTITCLDVDLLVLMRQVVSQVRTLFRCCCKLLIALCIIKCDANITVKGANSVAFLFVGLRYTKYRRGAQYTVPGGTELSFIWKKKIYFREKISVFAHTVMVGFVLSYLLNLCGTPSFGKRRKNGITLFMTLCIYFTVESLKIVHNTSSRRINLYDCTSD